MIVRRTARWLDDRLGASSFARTALDKIFPDHWSFMLGEIALYCFVILVLTGIYLAFFFVPSSRDVVYQGSYTPLHGADVSEAYASVLRISFEVRAGMVFRQMHHWAALVFVAAIVLHLIRVFFTGAFRKPRELTYLVGLAMLMVTLPEGYLGYSMVDELLSGMGLAIGYAVALSVPVVGANLANLLWGGAFPGDPAFESRMFIGHVLIFPIVIGALLTLHLVLVSARHHTQFRRERRQSETVVVGVPAFPGQAPRSLGLFFSVAAVLFLLGGLVQINPIWLWGPYSVGDATNAAQPDWYLGWLIGALRLVPSFDLTIGHYTLVPNPFWGGALFPLVVFSVLAIWPWVERRLTGDRAFHNVLDRPRDAPGRTAFGAALLTWVLLVFFSGSADRANVAFSLGYEEQIWVYRVLIVVLPPLVFLLTRHICRELQEGEHVEHDRERAEGEARTAEA